jgi:hypothetical protein
LSNTDDKANKKEYQRDLAYVHVARGEYDKAYEILGRTNAIGIAARKDKDGRGIEVLHVHPNGPADWAGLLPGDVLTEFDGETLKNKSRSEFLDEMIYEPEFGSKVRVKIYRNGLMEKRDLVVGVTPDLPKIARGDEVLPQPEEEDIPPPVVIIETPGDGQNIAQNSVSVRFLVVDDRRPIVSIHILVNGSPIDQKTRAIRRKTNKIRQNLSVPLEEGANLITVVASNGFSESRSQVKVFRGFSSARSAAEREQRIALLIGNGDYELSPLSNPVNDVTDMAGMLEECGFAVTKVINATRRQMRRAIRHFGNNIRGGGVGLFYYAGHGIQVNGQNYLVPIGADVMSEDEVEDECLGVSSVLRKMETAGNRMNIIMLDACRDNPFKRSFRSMQRGLAKMDAPTGSILVYATAPGMVASDGPDRNGLYTAAFMKHVLQPGLKIEDLLKKVRIEVLNSTAGRQVPWESSSLIGDFYFVK